MKEIMAIAASSMGFDTERLQSIAQNLANVATNGYKRNILVKGVDNSSFDKHIDALATKPNSNDIAIDNRTGTFRSTNNPLDLAIEGNGFFEIKTNDGVRYTRSGTFQVDQQGQLVTPAGQIVMGERGPITLSTSTPVIDKSGAIFEKDIQIDKIKIVSFTDINKLNYLGEGLYDAANTATDEKPGIVHIRQGFIETSNVSSMHEMVAMIETMRHFESMQKVVQGADGMHETVLSKLGQF